MWVIRKKEKFEMSHQLLSAFSSACVDCMHGHSYIAEFFFKSDALNSDGMVIDFGRIKSDLKPVIDKYDHSLSLSSLEDDGYVDTLRLRSKKINILPYNPTAEHMAKDIYDEIKEKQPLLYKVRLHETDTGWAEYFEEDNE